MNSFWQRKKGMKKMTSTLQWIKEIEIKGRKEINVKLRHMREDIESVSACRVQVWSIICFAIYFVVFIAVFTGTLVH